MEEWKGEHLIRCHSLVPKMDRVGGKEKDEAIRRCARAGMTKSQTARHLNISAWSISHWCKANPNVEFVDGRGTWRK